MGRICLDVGRDASPEEVKRAYKRRVKKVHPDTGGEKDDFVAVQGAFMVLSDPGRRSHFDQTGEIDEPPPDIVEAAAERIYAVVRALTNPAGKTWAELTDNEKEECRKLARAALNKEKPGDLMPV